MTAKRDLKRRVRQRQARTGESYVTARRRVLAAREEWARRGDALDGGEQTEPGATIERAETTGRAEATGTEETTGRQPKIEPESIGARAAFERAAGAEARAMLQRLTVVADMTPDELSGAGMPVVELHEVTGEARALGFRCRITVYPAVMEACELEMLLAGLRDALVRGAGDTGTARMFDVAFGLPSKEYVRVVPDPVGRITLLRFSVAGRRGPVAIACRLWLSAPTLILRLAADVTGELHGAEDVPMYLPDDLPWSASRSLGYMERELLEQLASLSRMQRPLFVVHEGRRYRVTHDRFVIGRAKGVDLTIRDGMMSRRHAAVVFRNRTYYVKDLGSTNGVYFKGMRIDNKRIDEGDVFVIGGHELRFTYRDER